MASAKFSTEMQRVVAEARLVALHLGCDYVSTLHFLVADCQLYTFWSLRDLLFGRQPALAAFLESLRVGPPISPGGSVPLLKECDQTLGQLRAVTRQYRLKEVLPCHFFVAASQVPTSLFARLLAANQVAPSSVLLHFERTGQLGAGPAEAELPLLGKVRRWLGR